MTVPGKSTCRDPSRVLDELLDSMSKDAPHPEARRAVAVALGLGTIAGTAAASAGAAASIISVVVKAVAVGAVAGVVVVGAAGVIAPGALQSGTSRTSPPTRRPGSALVPARGPTRDVSAPTTSTVLQVAEAPASAGPATSSTVMPIRGPRRDESTLSARPDPLPAQPDPLSAQPNALSTQPSSVTTTGEDWAPAKKALRDETAVLERASYALARGELASGLAEVDGYDSKFPSGVLKPEASLLRIEALVRMGNRHRAREVALTFQSRYPDSPHLARIRSLLASDQNPLSVP